MASSSPRTTRSALRAISARRLVVVAILVASAAAPPASVARPAGRATEAPALPASSSPDELFLAARDAYKANDLARVEAITQRLLVIDPRYPLVAYPQYWLLSRQIRDYGDALTAVAPTDAVRDFIRRNAGGVVADLARRDWLLALGKRGEWDAFDAEMPSFALNDDAQVTCFDLSSRALRQIRGATPLPRLAPEGATPEADAERPAPSAVVGDIVKAARTAIAQPRDFANDAGACATLARILVAEKRFGASDVWDWMRLGSDANNANAVRRYAQLLSDAEQGGNPVAFRKQLDAVLDKPALWLARQGDAGLGARWKRELTVLAAARVARNDPAMAGEMMARRPVDALPNADHAYLAAQIAAAMAKKQMPEANDWSRRSLAAEGLSEDILGWQVRGALRAEDWKLVEALIERMPNAMRQPQAADGTWAYWLGRAYKAQKKDEAAQKQFGRVADQFGFYGQLSTEELGQKVTLPPRAKPPSGADVAAMAARPGFQRALKLYSLDMRRGGNLEWNFTLRGMDDRELLAAAEFANRNQLLDRAVNTADRTRNEHDFAFRFLTPYRAQMQEKTAALGLELEWVYGLIRQESRFVQVARSAVGASGLMQIMPSTARYVARKIGMEAYRAEGVTDLDTNLTLGTSYLRMVLDDLDSLPVLATAAYNAGPGRSRAWRATLTKPVEGAIFVETIPFDETRDYVKKVMSNATYYAVLLTGAPQSLKTRMGFVAQRGYAPGDLP